MDDKVYLEVIHKIEILKEKLKDPKVKDKIMNMRKQKEGELFINYVKSCCEWVEYIYLKGK